MREVSLPPWPTKFRVVEGGASIHRYRASFSSNRTTRGARRGHPDALLEKRLWRLAVPFWFRPQTAAMLAFACATVATVTIQTGFTSRRNTSSHSQQLTHLPASIVSCGYTRAAHRFPGLLHFAFLARSGAAVKLRLSRR
jgi:hypothetical protein